VSMGDPAPGRRGVFLDLSPLRDSPAYARFWIGGVAGGIGAQFTIIAIGIHLYDITGSTAAVAAVGGFALVPMLVVGVIGGSVVDAYDRRTVLIRASLVAWCAPAAIAVLAWFNVEELWPYYALTTLSAATSTLVGTARFAIHPRLVPRHQLPAAAALSGMSAGLQAAVGPALAGLLIALVGYAWTYTIDVFLFFASFLGIVTLPPIPPSGTSRVGWSAIRDGGRFLRSASNIRTAIALQIVMLVFARPYVLFPAVGTLLIGGGPITVGILAASAAVGTILTGTFSGRAGAVRRHGRAIAIATIIAAICMLAFAGVLAALSVRHGWASPDHPDVVALILACVALAGAGGADNVAGIFRTTMLQSAAPDEVRGRLQGLFTLVLTAGPRLGDVVVGLVVAVGALWWPPLLGGVIVIAVVALLYGSRPRFRHYDALEPVP
jgi:MFS family permease